MQTTVIHSRRKTIAMTFDKDGGLVVRAPLRTPKTEIDHFIARHSGWIQKHRPHVCAAAKSRTAFRLEMGSRVLFLGRSYTILPRAEGQECGFYDGVCPLSADLTPNEIKAELVDLYRAAAREHLPARVHHFAGLMRLVPPRVRISNAKTRWGSCGVNVQFSWFLMMASPETVDYVVVHELAHLIHRDHAPAFWRVVESVLPDWRKRRATLAVLQKRLAGEDWDR